VIAGPRLLLPPFLGYPDIVTALREIRADYDRDTIVMWQAYDDEIADRALAQQRFVAPFSFTRMTWIKPSVLWLMHRSNWGQKRGQTRTLRVRIKRSGWDEALRLGVLTSPDGPVFGNAATWQREFDAAHVHVQWDPERSLRGAALNHYSIQVGLSRHIIARFVEEWIVSIEDFSPTVAKIYGLLQSGRAPQAQRLLPSERVYPVPSEVARRLMIA
jgi:hypothetical protein